VGLLRAGSPLPECYRDRALGRVLAALQTEGVTAGDPSTRRAAATMLSTTATPSAAAEMLGAWFGLGFRGKTRVAAALRERDAPATSVPAALELLDVADELEWRAIVATDAPAWAPPLPSQLRRRVATVVSAATAGHPKEQPAFWSHLRADASLDPALTIVVGESLDGDVRAPRSNGFATARADRVEALAELAEVLRANGRWPAEAIALVVGTPRPWGHRLVLEAPHLDALVARVTRFRARVHLGGDRPRAATVVRRAQGVPVVALDGELERRPLLVWISARADPRSLRPPSDLARRLDDQGLSLDALPLHERRYLISLVREARDGATRSDRMTHVVEHVRTRSEGAAV
jgi:hypothetical protein